MLKILGRKTSSNVMKVLWACDEMGVPYEREDIGGPFGGNDTPEYRAKNPMGLVPTIEHDGFVLWESQAIVRYLAGLYGQGTLWPEDPRQRAEADKWMDWNVSAIHAPMTTVFMQWVRTKPEDRDEKALEAATERAAKLWGILDKHLAGRPYVAGDRLTMGDIPLGVMVFRWFTLVKDGPSLPELAAWYARLQERAAYKTHCTNPLV